MSKKTITENYTPAHIDFETADLEKATVLADSNDKKVIKYLRAEPKAFVTSVKTEKGTKKYLKAGLGEPVAVLIGFKDGDEVLIGWAKRCTQKSKTELKHGKPRPIEPASFDKKTARKMAVLRGLCDAIIYTDVDGVVNTKDIGLPRRISRALKTFIPHVKKVFNTDKIANVIE